MKITDKTPEATPRKISSEKIPSGTIFRGKIHSDQSKPYIYFLGGVHEVECTVIVNLENPAQFWYVTDKPLAVFEYEPLDAELIVTKPTKK